MRPFRPPRTGNLCAFGQSPYHTFDASNALGDAVVSAQRSQPTENTMPTALITLIRHQCSLIAREIGRLRKAPWLLILGATCPLTLHAQAPSHDGHYHYEDQNPRNRLPDLGASAGGLIAEADEYRLGQMWLKMYRGQVPTSEDPLLFDYIKNLLNELAAHSDLKDPNLSLVITPNPTMNAFAVPGGVVGVNTGLFLYSDTEDQLASVLAHELAHLSQRHYARGVEKQKQASIPTLAATLGSILLAATVGGNAGMAALTATQAASLENRLRFSRQNEQEADRLGLQTMVRADRNPHASAEMFENMLKATRYYKRPPEFLLSHPVSERRIADAKNRARRFPVKNDSSDLSFHLMKSRVKLGHENNLALAIKQFRSELQGDSESKVASRYGLSLALIRHGQPQDAEKHLAILLKNHPNQLEFLLAEAERHAAAKNFDQGIKLLKSVLKKQPENHAANMTLAEVLMKAGRYTQAELVLTAESQRSPQDDHVWYLLAEIQGLTGNIIALHQARAEYFILNGIFDKAKTQLQNALRLSKTYYSKARIQQRLLDVENYKNTLQKL